MIKRTKPRSPSVKLTLLGESHGFQGSALQAFCDEKGVTMDELLSWRDLVLSGIELADRDGLGSTRKEHDAEMAFLREDLRRKNDALAETAALLILQKKLRRPWAVKSGDAPAPTDHYRHGYCSGIGSQAVQGL